MMKCATRFLGVLFALCGLATAAHATGWPSPDNPSFPDTIVYINGAIPYGAVGHPAVGDTVYGLGGIVVAKDTIPSGFAIYIQNNSTDGLGYHGIDVFTEGTNQSSSIGVDGGHPAGLYIGDSVMCYGATDVFNGSSELRSFGKSFNPPVNGPAIRLISRGNQVPAYHVGTVNSLNFLSTNTSSQPWVLNLVSVTANMRVARNVALQSASGNPRSFIVVDNATCPNGSPGPCDSMYVETATLAGVEPPPLNAAITFVRGLYNQFGVPYVYRIMARDPSDIGDMQPPGAVDAYSTSNDSILVQFDRAVTSASALNANNYSLSNFASTINPVHMVGNKQVVCFINNGESPGQAEAVTENNIVGQFNGVQQTTPGTRNFTYGILSLEQVRTPSPDSLNLAPCKDVSKFLGPDGGLTARLTTTGVCTAAGLGSVYYIEDPAATGFRSGAAVFAPTTALVRGHSYRISSAITDFFKEYELQGTVNIKDLGAGTIPAPFVRSIATLRDTTCDVNQNIENGEDWAGDLVQIQNAKITDIGRAPKQTFLVAGPYPACPDSILIGNAAGSAKFSNLFSPDFGTIVNVTGILHLVFGQYRIEPRDSMDIVIVSHDAVTTNIPKRVSFGISPNPARNQSLSFALPHRSDIELSVFDVTGRKLQTLARGHFEAGTYNKIRWDGTDASGARAGPGLYFYRLRVDGEVYRLSGVRLQ